MGVNSYAMKAIDAAVNRKEECWVIKDGNNVISYVWIGKQRIRIQSDTGYCLPSNSLNYWWRNISISQGYRGTGKLEEHLQAWHERVPNQGGFKLFCEISPANTVSLKCIPAMNISCKAVYSWYMCWAFESIICLLINALNSVTGFILKTFT